MKYVTDEILYDVVNKDEIYFKENFVLIFVNRYNRYYRIKSISHFVNDAYTVSLFGLNNIIFDRLHAIETNPIVSDKW